MAQYIRENMDYDRIVFVPTFCPPHKPYVRNSYRERYGLTKGFVDNHPHFEISDIDSEMGEPSYTYKLLETLYKQYKIDGKVGFPIGQDSFAQVESWFKNERIKTLVKFIVFAREAHFNPKIFADFKGKGYDFIVANTKLIRLSSTGIRNMVKKQGKTNGIENFVPAEVKNYIDKHKLYI